MRLVVALFVSVVLAAAAMTARGEGTCGDDAATVIHTAELAPQASHADPSAHAIGIRVVATAPCSHPADRAQRRAGGRVALAWWVRWRAVLRGSSDDSGH